MGKEFLQNCECFRVNTHIASHFLVSLLDVRTLKGEAKVIICKLFKSEILGGLDEVLKSALLGHGVSRAHDLPLVKVVGEVIHVYPLLLELKGMALVRHRQIETYGASFLKKMLGLEMVEGLDWMMEFDQFVKLNGL